MPKNQAASGRFALLATEDEAAITSGKNLREGALAAVFANFAGLGQTLSSSQLLHWHVSLFFINVIN
jgi:hypothetical protein